MKRTEERRVAVSLFDGRGIANVWVEDGYGRPVSEIRQVVGVHSEEEARAATRAEKLFQSGA